MENYKLGDRVKVSSDNDNDYYDSFRNKILIVTGISRNTEDHQGYDEGLNGEALYDLKDLKGNNINCSLYDYELTKV